MQRNPTLHPTVGEVLVQSYWWACTPGVTEPRVMQLGVDVTEGITSIVNLEDGEIFIPQDCGTHFSPREPPSWMLVAPVAVSSRRD